MQKVSLYVWLRGKFSLSKSSKTQQSPLKSTPGFLQFAVDFGPGAILILSNSRSQPVLLKYSEMGEFQWVRLMLLENSFVLFRWVVGWFWVFF